MVIKSYVVELCIHSKDTNQLSLTNTSLKTILLMHASCFLVRYYAFTRRRTLVKQQHARIVISFFMAVGLPLGLTATAFAATSGNGDVSQIENFIRSLIKVVAGLAGLVATFFFVVGGFSYITSSGNPDHLDRAKKTLMFSGLGLAITIGAFVLSNIVTTLASNAFGS